MAGRLTSILDTLSDRRAVRRWANAADEADRLDLPSLKSLRGRARQVRREIDRLIRAAELRLAAPEAADRSLRRPMHSDWAWRPDPWRVPVWPTGHAAVESRTTIAPLATVFHDCRESELTVRQVRNTRATDLSPYGFRFDVFRFDGSFLSLVIDLPDDTARSLRLRHIVRVDAVIEVERPIEIFARLNVRHGPNTEQVVREFSLEASETNVEFDLAYTKLNEKRIEKAWLDLIFEGPQFNQILLRDLTMSRRPRAEV